MLTGFCGSRPVASYKWRSWRRPLPVGAKIQYCTLLHVSAVQISHLQVDVGYTKRNIKGENRLLFTVSGIVTVFHRKWNNKFRTDTSASYSIP
jgi:hypothetical protein